VVRVFGRIGATWQPQAVLENEDGGAGFGHGLAVSGGRLAVLRESPPGQVRLPTQVHLFTRSDETWRRELTIDASILVGTTVAIHGESMTIGARSIATADRHRWPCASSCCAFESPTRAGRPCARARSVEAWFSTAPARPIRGVTLLRFQHDFCALAPTARA
jgi:hypothetical protein